MSDCIVELPYGSRLLRFSVPERNLLGTYVPQPLSANRTAAELVAAALAAPIGGPSLRTLARGARKVVLVADDNTRPTPTDVILPLLLDELNAAGVRDEDVHVLIALGTHRKMSAPEIDVKFGTAVTQRVAIINHEAFHPEALVDLGVTRNGVAVQVNRHVLEADLVVGIGSIVPHHIPGFSGGAKIIQPGVCGEQTTGQVHLLSVRREHSLLGVLENPVREEMEAIAERAGLRAILNTVLNGQGEVVGAVYGDYRAAFRQGVQLSRRIYGVAVERPADIVIAGSHPCDSEFWQAHKTLYAAEMCVRAGGSIIVVTPCPEGVAATHGDMLAFAGWPWERLDAALRAGQIRDLTAGALALAWANTRRRADVSLVSDGITPDEVRALGFTPYANVQEALQAALARHGQEATICVLPYAPDTLPVLSHPSE